MGLVERLMHLDPVDGRNMAVHTFFAAVTELLAGQLTAQQVTTYYQMTAEDLADWNALAALIPGATQVAARAMWLQRIHGVFILAEARAPLYDTPANVRARLGIA